MKEEKASLTIAKSLEEENRSLWKKIESANRYIAELEKENRLQKLIIDQYDKNQQILLANSALQEKLAS